MMDHFDHQNLQTIIDALVAAGCGPVGSPEAGWSAMCPAHDDHDPSLSVTLAEDGRWLVHCHAGCDTKDVLDALGLPWSALFPGGGSSGGGTAYVSRPRWQTPKTDPATCDRAYRAVLDRLPLWLGHRTDLRDRGLSDAEIERRQYRSTPENPQEQPGLNGRWLVDLADGTRTVEGPVDTAGVPGIRDGALVAPPGLLVPVRDVHGRIVAGQVRLDHVEDGKYRWLVGSGSPVHVPLWDGSREVVRVTEGPLKADVATALSGTLTIGTGGAGTARKAVDTLRELGARTVLVAFDADQPGQDANRDLVDALAGSGLDIDVFVETWPADAGKGIDDVYTNGRAEDIEPAKCQVAPIGPNLSQSAHDGETAAVPDADDGAANGRKPSQATELVNIARRDYILGQSEQGEPFAVPKRGPRVALVFRGGKGATTLGSDLARTYFERTHSPDLLSS